MTSWLNKQRKQALLELSADAGLKQEGDARKDELVEALDSYLQQNATRLSRNPAFEPYYGTRRTPFKQHRASAAPATMSDDGEVRTVSVVMPRGRLSAKVKREVDDDDGDITSPSQTLVTSATTSSSHLRTPGRPHRMSELPASPADVADDVEYATTRLYSRLGGLYSLSGIPDTIEYVRDICSSVVGVQMTCIFTEAYALQREILPHKYAFDIPAIPSLHTSPIPIKATDFFVLLTGSFWSTALLWASTSIFVPLLFAYFYNLSSKDIKRNGSRITVSRYSCDPLTFNVVKALVTYIVYARGYSLYGLIDPQATSRVNHAMFGGYNGILIGSFVGILVSLYEAAQRK